MKLLAACAALLVMSGACWRLSRNGRDIVAYAMIAAAMAALLLIQSGAKATFTGLAILSVAGFLVTLIRGMQSQRR